MNIWNLPLDVAKACDEVVENKKLIMRRLLAIGNIMNESAAGKSKTAGIAPDSLIKTDKTHITRLRGDD